VTLDIMGHTDVTRVRREGDVGHRGLESRDVIEAGELRLVGLADTWCDLGEVARRGLGRDDLAVAAGAAVRKNDNTHIEAGMHPNPRREGSIVGVVASSPGILAPHRALDRRNRPAGSDS
jgi:hypothetical protein